MDMRIAGRGKIPAGEYRHIKISGGGQLFGAVRCLSFRASGRSKGERIECAERFKTSGSSAFSDGVRAAEIRAAGSLVCGGDLIASGRLSVSGTLKVGGNIEAEEVRISGDLRCEGLLNAERIELGADKPMTVGSVGGSCIRMHRKRISVIPKRGVSVSQSIEGDELTLSHVCCPRVTGRVLRIGKGCRIDLVQYSESLEASPKARIGRIEKI